LLTLIVIPAIYALIKSASLRGPAAAPVADARPGKLAVEEAS